MLPIMKSSCFHAAVTRWFENEFAAPTAVQRRAWQAIGSSCDTLIGAPTGSGKTLAAFLAVIDRLVKQAQDGPLADETQVLYVSPLKALSNDIQKNLQAPLEGIRRELAAEMLPDAPIRASVRTGDTPQSERARMRRTPPHILVTTPESLFILLTSGSGRAMLSTVRTVIIDEIHAVAGSKRGAHLSLSLERLAALCAAPPARVGISATTGPIDGVARFLTGASDRSCEIIDEGHARERDLAIELTPSPLEAVMSNEVWTEIYDRLAELIEAHRTTIVFVNTRRLAERAARHLGERLGEEHVTSHHGSLAKEHRLRAEERLKAGRLKALVATASLELGIDIGDVDLVCQLGSPHAISALLQRVGRSGHGLRRLPKGRLFPLSRDELVECVALLECVRHGELDAVRICRAPLDVLAQQIVAEVSMQQWQTGSLFRQFKRSACYEDLERVEFDGVLEMLSEGFSTQRGRRSAFLHHDRVNEVVRGRRGAGLTAITNGGAIPDHFDYDVVLLPGELPVGTLNEDFAFESLPGDIFQLGNTSYRIARVHSGKVYVEDAKGQPPNIPFWLGEAPGRSDELSRSVSELRKRIDAALDAYSPAELAHRLMDEMRLPEAAATQLVEYLATAKAALGMLPSRRRIVFERFFDETGDTHLVVHSPLGSRLNRAWGLALRKRFCRRFNFELQAAALEDSIVLSLGAVHSFALDEVIRYLSSDTVDHVLSQAVIGAPIFPTYWRWNASIALAVRRFRNGKKIPAQFQRTDSEDLLAAVFPDQLACAENLGGGDIAIPDHPLVAQTMRDCLHGAMDVDGLKRLLEDIETGRVRVLCRELASPSPLAQEVLAAKAYAFLDDAPAEERRTLAVQARRFMSVEEAADLGRLDLAAIERVRAEAWPEARDPDELHDALVVLGFMTEDELARTGSSKAHVTALENEGRATCFALSTGCAVWVSAERLGELRLLDPGGAAFKVLRILAPGVESAEGALRELLRSRLQGLGPVTAEVLGAPLGLNRAECEPALRALEQEGFAMRGAYTGPGRDEWCERRLLARIHRYTLKRLRSEIQPVSLAEYQRFLFDWQGLGAERREGAAALRRVLGELQGLALPASVWESSVLPARIRDYGGDLLDSLCVSGEFVWWRPPARTARSPTTTVAASPITIVPRSALAEWGLLSSLRQSPAAADRLSSQAAKVLEALHHCGASFFVEIVQATGLLRTQVEDALGELVARGLVTADAFNGLRALLTPQRHRMRLRARGRRPAAVSGFDAAGRWSRLQTITDSDSGDAQRRATEHAATTLLRRYGVVTRTLLERETLVPSWRELLDVYRRAEARGEIRGGRFVGPLGGEQFALKHAVERLRQLRRAPKSGDWTVISAVDPVNVCGTAGRGDNKVPLLAGNRIAFRDGIAVAALTGAGLVYLCDLQSYERRQLGAMLSLPWPSSGGLAAVPRGKSA
jgi:ATP-dependent Lhr-like helicase